MTQTRRTFLGAAATFAALSAWGATSLVAQEQGQTGAEPPPPPLPEPPPRDEPLVEYTPRELAMPAPWPRMKVSPAQIKKSSARLVQLAGELQKNLEASDTTNVLSLSVVRKAEEIEKLARQIRTWVRG